MASKNLCIFIGNLGGDPEIRYLPNGSAVANFTIAVNESWKDKEGAKQERVEWVKIVVWGKLAEICAEYLHKGKQVYIEGRMQTRQWDDKEGNKRYTTEIVASQMLMFGSKGDGQAKTETAEPRSDPSGPPPVDEDDIPF